MNKTISINQIALILVVIMMGSKFLQLPAMIAMDAGRDGWISILVLFAVDLMSLSMLLLCIKLNKNRMSLHTILKNSLGSVVSKILFFLLAVFYWFRLIDLMTASETVFSATLTLKTNWPGFSLPLLFYFAFIMKQGLQNLARVTELLGGVIILAALSVIGLSAVQTDFTNIKPILADGFSPVFKGAFNHTFWFSDMLFIVFLVGKASYRKHIFYQPLTAFCIGVFITVSLYIVFYCIYGETAWMQTGAMQKISQFTVKLTANGRLDWISVLMWLFSVFIKMTISCFCLISALQDIFNCTPDRPNYILTVAVLISLLVVPLIVTINETTVSLFSDSPVKYLTWIVQYLLPLSLPLLLKIAERKDNRICIPSND